MTNNIDKKTKRFIKILPVFQNKALGQRMKLTSIKMQNHLKSYLIHSLLSMSFQTFSLLTATMKSKSA